MAKKWTTGGVLETYKTLLIKFTNHGKIDATKAYESIQGRSIPRRMVDKVVQEFEFEIIANHHPENWCKDGSKYMRKVGNAMTLDAQAIVDDLARIGVRYEIACAFVRDIFSSLREGVEGAGFNFTVQKASDLN